MPNHTKYALYAAYVTIVGIVLLYALFPSETVKEYLIANVQGRNPDLGLTIDGVRPTLSLGIRLRKIGLEYKQSPMLDVDHIAIRPRLWSLLGEEKAFDFKGKTNDGRFSGTGGMSTGAKTGQIEIEVEFSDIQMDTIPAVQQLSDREITGLLGGKVVYIRKGIVGAVSANLTLENGIVDLDLPVLKLQRLSFEKIETDLALNRQMVRVRTFTLSGEQMDGDFSGTIRLKQPLGNSAIKLSGALKAHPLFLDELAKTIPKALFPKKLRGEKGLPVRLKGTLEKPGFALK